MPHQGRTVGIDVSKLKADACIRALQLRLSRRRSRPRSGPTPSSRRNHPEHARVRPPVCRRSARLAAGVRPPPQQGRRSGRPRPYGDDSGEHRGERHIRGGRREIRDLLYMAGLGAASGHNPVIRACYQRLCAKGKKAKVALVACMRKLIVILNTMLARAQMWNPPAAALVA